MRFYKLDNWNDEFRHDGVLYFSQRIQEMLCYYSDHIYKAPVLNSYLLIGEYVNTASLVRKKIINDNHLKYIMEEFQDTFSNDIVLLNRLGEEKIKEFLQKLNTSSQDEQEKIMKYLLHTLDDYNVWCKDYLKEIVVKEKEKKKIERALRCYIPALIDAGYSQEYIYFYNRKIFSETAVNSIKALDDFLDRFDFKDKQFEVYVAISKEATKFKTILNNRLDVNFDFDFDISDLKYNTTKYKVVNLKVHALDERMAASRAYECLDLFFRYYSFVGDQRSNWLFNKGKVVDEQGHIAFVDLYPNGFDYSVRIGKKDAGKMSEKLITALLSNAKCSFPVIDRAVSIHNTAITETDIKNGFLNFWSIFEILFVSDQDDSKIAEIERKALPVLQKDYIHTLVYEIKLYISKNIPEATIAKFRESNSLSDDEYWLQKIIFLTEYSNARKELYDILVDLPIIRSRISQLNESHSKKENILKDVERYSKRIEWHLRRLYRTRNAIIHSGETPDHLKQLGEHLHSYIDGCLLEIAIALATKPNLCTIDNVVIDVQLKSEETMKFLRKKGTVDEEAIDYLFNLHS